MAQTTNNLINYEKHNLYGSHNVSGNNHGSSSRRQSQGSNAFYVSARNTSRQNSLGGQSINVNEFKDEEEYFHNSNIIPDNASLNNQNEINENKEEILKHKETILELTENIYKLENDIQDLKSIIKDKDESMSLTEIILKQCEENMFKKSKQIEDDKIVFIKDLAHKEKQILDLHEKTNYYQELNFKLTHLSKDKKKFAAMEQQIKDLTCIMQNVRY